MTKIDLDRLNAGLVSRWQKENDEREAREAAAREQRKQELLLEEIARDDKREAIRAKLKASQ